MHFDEMSALVEREFDKIRAVRETKGKEYAGEEDTLADFKEVALAAGITPYQVWLTYVEKHQRAIATFVREGGVKSESIESRIMDVVVYHLLLLGLIEDDKVLGVRFMQEDIDAVLAGAPRCHAEWQGIRGGSEPVAVRCSRVAMHNGDHLSLDGTPQLQWAQT